MNFSKTRLFYAPAMLITKCELCWSRADELCYDEKEIVAIHPHVERTFYLRYREKVFLKCDRESK